MTDLEIALMSFVQAHMRRVGTWKGSRTRISDIRAKTEQVAGWTRDFISMGNPLDEEAIISELMRRAGMTTTLEAYR